MCLFHVVCEFVDWKNQDDHSRCVKCGRSWDCRYIPTGFEVVELRKFEAKRLMRSRGVRLISYDDETYLVYGWRHVRAFDSLEKATSHYMGKVAAVRHGWFWEMLLRLFFM